MTVPRVVSAEEVPALLSMAHCIEAVEEAFRALARGEVIQPLRTVIGLPDGTGSLLAMPAFTADPPALGAKLLTLFPGNHGTRVPSHQGVVLLFDPEDGSLRLVVDARPLTALRTAAASAVATRQLARPDARVLAILGSGVQARSHLEAMLLVRPIEEVRVWSPTPAHREALADEAQSWCRAPVTAVGSAEAAVDSAELVCTVTASNSPILKGRWLAPGTHLNLVGASTATTREVDSETVAGASVYVDSMESALAEAGDLLIPLEEGRFGPDHLRGDIGALLEGAVPGRGSDDEITLFKSLGLAIQDLAAAREVERSLFSAGEFS